LQNSGTNLADSLKFKDEFEVLVLKEVKINSTLTNIRLRFQSITQPTTQHRSYHFGDNIIKYYSRETKYINKDDSDTESNKIL